MSASTCPKPGQFHRLTGGDKQPGLGHQHGQPQGFEGDGFAARVEAR